MTRIEAVSPEQMKEGPFQQRQRSQGKGRGGVLQSEDQWNHFLGRMTRMVGEIISPMHLTLPTHLLTSFKQMKQLNDRSCRCHCFSCRNLTFGGGLGIFGIAKSQGMAGRLLQSVQHREQWGIKLTLQVTRTVP